MSTRFPTKMSWRESVLMLMHAVERVWHEFVESSPQKLARTPRAFKSLWGAASNIAEALSPCHRCAIELQITWNVRSDEVHQGTPVQAHVYDVDPQFSRQIQQICQSWGTLLSDDMRLRCPDAGQANARSKMQIQAARSELQQ